jgi:hypothetical protein
MVFLSLPRQLYGQSKPVHTTSEICINCIFHLPPTGKINWMLKWKQQGRQLSFSNVASAPADNWLEKEKSEKQRDRTISIAFLSYLATHLSKVEYCKRKISCFIKCTATELQYTRMLTWTAPRGSEVKVKSLCLRTTPVKLMADMK